MMPLLRAAMLPPIVANAIKVSLVVGSVLNIINNGGDWLHGLPIDWLGVCLNFAVPYCVASYSAAKNELNKTVRDV